MGPQGKPIPPRHSASATPRSMKSKVPKRAESERAARPVMLRCDETKDDEAVVEDEKVFMGLNVYVDMGKHVHRLSKYPLAMEFYNKAAEYEPDSHKLPVPKATTLIKLADFTEAMEQIAKLEEAAEDEDEVEAEDEGEGDGEAVSGVPLSAQTLQAEALWQGALFEQAAVLAARGMRRRRQPPYFTEMYYTSVATLDQCVGAPAQDVLDMLAENEALMERLSPEPESTALETQPRRHYVKPKTREELCREQRYLEFLRMRRLARARLYLGDLGEDIEFLDNLVEHPALQGFRPSEAAIRQHVHAVSEDITKRMNYIEEECPTYTLEYRALGAQGAHGVSRVVTRERAERAERLRDDATASILRALAARESGDLRVFRQALRSARDFFEGVTRRQLPDKGDYQALLYHLIGVTYMQLVLLRIGHDVTPEERARLRRHHVRTILQAGDTKDVITTGVAIPFFDYARSLRVDERRIKRARSKLERLCITVEMAHCCSKLHRWEKSLNLSRKALAMAKEEGHNVWVVLAAVERCKAEVHLNTRLEAKATIREAIEMAEVLDDEYILEILHAIAEALEDPAGYLLRSDAEEEAEPQERIMRLMADDALRSRCTEMFARINALPPEYRMSLHGRWMERDEAVAPKKITSGTATFFRES